GGRSLRSDPMQPLTSTAQVATSASAARGENRRVTMGAPSCARLCSDCAPNGRGPPPLHGAPPTEYIIRAPTGGRSRIDRGAAPGGGAHRIVLVVVARE